MSNMDSDEIRIDLLELINRLILQWKLVIILVLCGGIALGAIKYAESIQATANKNVKSDKMQSKDIGAEMGIAEKDAVDTVAGKVIRTNDMSEYVDNAIIMQLDPVDCRTLECVYKIYGINVEDAEVVKKMYEQFISSNEFTEEISKVMGLNANENFVDEIIKCEYDNAVLILQEDEDAKINNSTGVLSINVIVPTDVDIDKLSDVIKESVMNYSKEVSTIIQGCKVDYVSENVCKGTDRSIQTNKYNFINMIINEKYLVRTSVSGFSETQKKYFVALLSENGFSEEDIILYSGDDKLMSDIEPKDDTDMLGIIYVLKWFCIGAITVLLCFTGFMLIAYRLKPKAGRLFGMGMINGYPVMGTICGDFVKKNRLKHKLYKINGDMESQADLIISSIKFYMNNINEKNISLALFGDVSSETELIKKEWNKQFGGDISVVDMNEVNQSALYKKLDTMGSAAVLVIKNDSILIEEVNRVFDLMKERSVEIVGRVEVL